ncbi:MAG: hypothetical protein HY043_21895 [Verrucomicrobia bacterium]|nr:hypothetical protein [Verrucomicrobiota bacterium]
MSGEANNSRYGVNFVESKFRGTLLYTRGKFSEKLRVDIQDVLADKPALAGGSNSTLLLVGATVIGVAFLGFLLADAYRVKQRAKRFNQKRGSK